MCTNDDLKELGVPLGPRKKLSSFIIQQAELKKQAEERRRIEEKERLKKEREGQKQQEAVDSALHRATLQGVKIVRGLAGTGQPYIDYPQLNFKPRHLFAVGSPVGLFLSIRSVQCTRVHVCVVVVNFDIIKGCNSLCKGIFLQFFNYPNSSEESTVPDYTKLYLINFKLNFLGEYPLFCFALPKIFTILFCFLGLKPERSPAHCTCLL